MTIDMSVNVLPFVTWLTPTETKSIEEMQKEVIEGLDTAAEPLPFDRRQQFLAGVRRYAGDILKFLDYMEKQGESTIKIKETANELFSELKTIGEQLARASDVHHQQFSREMSTYEDFKNFQIKFSELTPAKEHHVPSFTEIMARAQHARAEDQIQQNMALAKMTAGMVRAAGEGSVEAVKMACYSSPLMCKAVVLLEEAAGHPVKKALTEVAETFHSLLPDHRALSHELNSQFGISLEEGKQYGDDALVVGMAMLPVPPVAKLVGRILPQAAKPLVSSGVSRGSTFLRTAEKFLKEDAGTVKLPVDPDYWIDRFLEIGYTLSKGGKGNHIKLTKANRPMVTIPKELPRGTAKNIMRTHAEAKKLDLADHVLLQEESVPKPTKPLWNYDKPLPDRLNMSAGYSESAGAFVEPKEFVGVLKKDLYVVRYHHGSHVDMPHKHKNWMPIAESDRHKTLRAMIESLANPVAPEELTHVSFAKIPEGQQVRFLYGKTKPRVELMTNAVQKGGAVQYRFFDFDPAWIKQTREFQK